MPNRKIVLVLVSLLAAAVFAAPARAHYEAMMGRFLQADPYATGLIVQRDPGWFHGRAPMPQVPVAPDLRLHYWNGANHYEFLGSNPPMRRDPLGLYWNDLRPGQLLGPGWSQGGVIMYDPREYRAAQASRVMGFARAWIKQGLRGAGQELLIGGMQLSGAGFAHVLYGQDGPAAGDVLGATAYQIAKRGARQAGGNLGLSYGWDFYDGGRSAWDGNWADAGVSTVKGLTNSLIDYMDDPAVRGFRSAAARISAIGVVGAGIYSGIQEYMVNDALNWGFGVEGRDLYDFWD